ncbi:MAG: hypothetical protein K6A67_11145, partial [Bacteroidales bacterium]|nr:hypothetical protein [Bacteroidales bacterium]
VREDGAVLHTQSAREFEAFVSSCDTLCGHNIINHDLKYLEQSIPQTSLSEKTIIDTLQLSVCLANLVLTKVNG